MRKPLQDFQSDNYERPNQSWICGLKEMGEACPSGPGNKGRCPHASACHPLRKGDRWECNRSDARGGKCEEGPTPDGECCHVYKCSPIRSLRSRRGRFVIGCFAATLGGLCLMLSASSRNEFLAPGELSVHHAQLLERADNTDRCASCHAAGSETIGEWVTWTFSEVESRSTQTTLCLKCHDKQFSRQWATSAHNVDPADLIDEAGTGHRRRDPHQPLACSTCHQEHHGTDHDLTWMSDKTCQACHQEQYTSFATDHPEFDKWPMARRTRIAFDHVSHEMKHFPEENETYSCSSCHQPDTTGEFQKTLAYDQACAKCHDQDIKTSWENGIALITLPMIDMESLQKAGHSVGQWPVEAQGDFDGSFSPVAKLLIAADAKAARAFEVLGTDFDFFDVDPEQPDQLQAAADMIRAVKRLFYDLSVRGQDAFRERIEIVIQRKLTDQELADLTSRLSPENLQVLAERWIPALASEFEMDGSLNELPLNLPSQEFKKASERAIYGGWVRDDLTLSVRYVPTGHADPWMTSWINVMTEATQGRHADLAEELLRTVMKPSSAGQCGSCHSIDRTNDVLEVHWYPKRQIDSDTPFTRFSHGPHLIQAELADCASCHQSLPDSRVMENYKDQNPHVYEPGFEPITKASCAECHVSGAAGDSCLQCHQYHVGELLPE